MLSLKKKKKRDSLASDLDKCSSLKLLPRLRFLHSNFDWMLQLKLKKDKKKDEEEKREKKKGSVSDSKCHVFMFQHSILY